MFSAPYKSAVQRLRYGISCAAGQSRLTMRLYAKMLKLPYKIAGVTPVDAVIEGFPRSANTFAVIAFSHAQSRPVRIGSHTHMPAQVISAVRANLPTLVLIREPRDAIASLLIRDPMLSARQVIKQYLRYYRTLDPYKHLIVIATFKQATSDLAEVIERMNARFNTNFKKFEHTAENLHQCYARIDAAERTDSGGPLRETHVARPSPKREQIKDMKIKYLDEGPCSSLITEATQLYNTWCRVAR